MSQHTDRKAAAKEYEPPAPDAIACEIARLERENDRSLDWQKAVWEKQDKERAARRARCDRVRELRMRLSPAVQMEYRPTG